MAILFASEREKRTKLDEESVIPIKKMYAGINTVYVTVAFATAKVVFCRVAHISTCKFVLVSSAPLS
jgi:hypothetical protein